MNKNFINDRIGRKNQDDNSESPQILAISTSDSKAGNKEERRGFLKALGIGISGAALVGGNAGCASPTESQRNNTCERTMMYAFPDGFFDSLTCFNSNGSLVACCVRSIIKIWDVSTGDLKYVVNEDGAVPLFGIALDNKGTKLAVSRWDGSISVWNLGDPNGNRKSINGFETAVIALVYLSPDGTLVATTAFGNAVVHDTINGARMAMMEGCVTKGFSPDGKYLAVQKNYSDIIIYNTVNFEPILNVKDKAFAIFCNDGNSFITGTSKEWEQIRIFDGKTEQLISVDHLIVPLAITSANTMVVSNGEMLPSNIEIISINDSSVQKSFNFSATVNSSGSVAAVISTESSGMNTIETLSLRELPGGTVLHYLVDPALKTTEIGDCTSSNNPLCSCDTVCKCDSVCSCDTICTCDSEGGGGGCSYWYPN